MILLSVLASIAAIGVICCLLFYLAVYALPLFVGVMAGVWAYSSGAGWLGGIAVGAVAGLATLFAGHLLLVFVKPLWLRLIIAAAFVAPAAIAGYHATHGIVKHTMPSETWQVVFSLVGAVVEEVLFRGALQGNLSGSRVGPAGAILITSLVWALGHGATYVQPPGIKETQIFGLGLIFGIMRERHGLRGSLALHLLNNGLVVLLHPFFK